MEQNNLRRGILEKVKRDGLVNSHHPSAKAAQIRAKRAHLRPMISPARESESLCANTWLLAYAGCCQGGRSSLASSRVLCGELHDGGGSRGK